MISSERGATGRQLKHKPLASLLQAAKSATEVALAINAVAFNMFVMLNVSSVN